MNNNDLKVRRVGFYSRLDQEFDMAGKVSLRVCTLRAGFCLVSEHGGWDVADQPTMHRAVLTLRSPAQKVSSAKVEKP